MRVSAFVCTAVTACASNLLWISKPGQHGVSVLMITIRFASLSGWGGDRHEVRGGALWTLPRHHRGQIRRGGTGTSGMIFGCSSCLMDGTRYDARCAEWHRPLGRIWLSGLLSFLRGTLVAIAERHHGGIDIITSAVRHEAPSQLLGFSVQPLLPYSSYPSPRLSLSLCAISVNLCSPYPPPSPSWFTLPRQAHSPTWTAQTLQQQQYGRLPPLRRKACQPWSCLRMSTHG